MEYDFSFPEDGLEKVNEYSTGEFTKYRFKSSDLTVDISLIEAEDIETQIEERKEEYRDMTVRVPSPYTSEIQERQQDNDYPVEFQEKNGRVYGEGYAGPEYRPMMDEGGQIPRYRFLVTWKKLTDSGRLAEFEVFVPVDDYSAEDALDFVDATVVEELDQV